MHNFRDDTISDIRDHITHFLNSLQSDLAIPQLLATIKNDPQNAALQIQAAHAVVHAKREIAQAILRSLHSIPADGVAVEEEEPEQIPVH